jgi:transcriptional regulator with XRE-family HTH domain
MTQQILADRAGVSLSYIEKIERGDTKRPSASTLTAISSVLNVSLNALLRPAQRLEPGSAQAPPDTLPDKRSPSARPASSRQRAGRSEDRPKRAGKRHRVHEPESATVADHDSLSADITELMAWINGTNTTDDAIEQIERATAYLAEAHSRIPPQTALAGVLQTHEQAQAYLRGGRQRLRQTRELLRIDSSLLSHACLLLGDLGHNRKAAQYGTAALALAQEAGSDEAAAWSVRAKTARWQERYLESAELARHGFEAAAPSPTKVELAYREANAIALFGDAGRARKALRSAQAAAEVLTSDRDPGYSVWSFNTPRQAIFALSVAIHIGDPDSALQAAARADAAWASGQRKVPATYAQIQAGTSIAYLMKGSLDGAACHIAPVLSLPQESRISTIIGYVRKLEHILAQSRLAGSAPATDLAHQIRDFISAAPPGEDTAD